MASMVPMTHFGAQGVLVPHGAHGAHSSPWCIWIGRGAHDALSSHDAHGAHNVLGAHED